eukprot:TCONS_00072580-protein
MNISIISIGHFVLTFVGGSANLIAIWCLYKETMSFSSIEDHNIFILSLAISDLLVSLVYQPLSGIQFVIGRPIQASVIRYISGVLLSMSLLNLSLLSLERVIKITLPNKHDSWMEKGKIIKLILMCWVLEGIIYSTSFFYPTLFGITIMLHVVGTLLILIISYTLVYRQERRSTKILASFSTSKCQSSNPSNSQASNSTIKQTKNRERRLIKNVLTLLLTHFVFVVIILIIVGSAISTADDPKQRDFAFFLGVLIATVNPSCVNPIFYVFRTKKNRKRVLNIFCCRKKRVVPE